MKLGVLDQVPVRAGGSAVQAINETFDLARAADRLGYSRYWLAEHHNAGSLACTAPEILIPQVASRTERIRVGSGGVMLSHYSPLKVAELFGLIETLYPGRIDLGIGRAPGTDGRTARALATGPTAGGLEHFPDQLADLYGFLAHDLPPDHAFHGIEAGPSRTGLPELWLLGSSTMGAMYAADLGWALSFAQFISPDGGEAVIRNYRERFEPSPFLSQPRVSLGVSVTCAETMEEAEELSRSRWLWRIKSNRGIRGGIPSTQEALDFPYTEAEREYLDYLRLRSVYGDPAQVRERLEQMATAYQVEEFIVLTITHKHADRVRSYELLAKVFDLAVVPEPAGASARAGTALPSRPVPAGGSEA